MGGDAGVDFCGGDAGVAQQFLDIPEVDSLFQEVRGKAVAEGVRGGFFLDAGPFERPSENIFDAGRTVLLASGAFKEPSGRLIDPVVFPEHDQQLI